MASSTFAHHGTRSATGARNGSFVQRRDDAVSCYVCPAGTSSQEFRDDDGQSYRCAACEPGALDGRGFVEGKEADE